MLRQLRRSLRMMNVAPIFAEHFTARLFCGERSGVQGFCDFPPECGLHEGRGGAGIEQFVGGVHQQDLQINTAKAGGHDRARQRLYSKIDGQTFKYTVVNSSLSRVLCFLIIRTLKFALCFVTVLLPHAVGVGKFG